MHAGSRNGEYLSVVAVTPRALRINPRSLGLSPRDLSGKSPLEVAQQLRDAAQALIERANEIEAHVLAGIAHPEFEP